MVVLRGRRIKSESLQDPDMREDVARNHSSAMCYYQKIDGHFEMLTGDIVPPARTTALASSTIS